MTDDNMCCKAEEPKDLEDKIMNCNIPKNAAEWWAREEIIKLRDQLEDMTAQFYSISERI